MTRHAAWILTLALIATVAATGCRRRGAIRDGRRLDRYEQNLVRLAARDSRCGPEVQPVRVSDRVWVVNTCAGPREYVLACRRRRCNWRRVPTVPEAAAQYLGCPPQAVQQQVSPNPMVRSAAGCGRQLQVALQCGARDCAWTPTGPPAAGPASSPTAPPGYGAGGSAVIYVPGN